MEAMRVNTGILSQPGIELRDGTTASYLGVIFKGTGNAKQRARIKAIKQYCALEHNSAR